MSSTEVATVSHGSALVLASDQEFWSERQIAALRQMGVQDASGGDLAVFFHVSQRTGLDPFARQIHMVSRNAKERGEWVKKWTIQTGIDGFRLVADRADHRDGTLREYEDTLWRDADGNWTDAWDKPTPPVAAKVVVIRNGRRFPGQVMYREFVQTKSDGDPNGMWFKMPANQLAKCAEAAALRKAYPQDLSGMYTDEEMAQADNPPAAPQQPRRGGLAAVLPDHTDASPAPDAATSESPAPTVEASAGEAPDSPMLDFRSKLARRMFAVLGSAGLGGDTDEEKATRLAEVSAIIGRTITTSKDMTVGDARAVINTLEVRDGNGEDPVDAELVEDGDES